MRHGLARFAKAIASFPEVMDCYRMSGEIDYLIRLVLPDIDAYDAFYKRLIAKIELSDVTSMFAMGGDQVDDTAAAYRTCCSLAFLPIRMGRWRVGTFALHEQRCSTATAGGMTPTPPHKNGEES